MDDPNQLVVTLEGIAIHRRRHPDRFRLGVLVATVKREVFASSKSDEWHTPPWLFNWCAAIWGPFGLDVAAASYDAKCDRYYTQAQDGLLKPWSVHSRPARVWCNPPYSSVKQWVERAAKHAERGGTALLLIPARTDSHWFHDYCFRSAASITFIRGRIAFDNPSGKVNSAPFPSCLVWYSPAGCIGKHMARIQTIDVKTIKAGER